jgi:hypothetical protein
VKLFIAELFYTKRRGYGEFFLDYFLKFALMGHIPLPQEENKPNKEAAALGQKGQEQPPE